MKKIYSLMIGLLMMSSRSLMSMDAPGGQLRSPADAHQGIGEKALLPEPSGGTTTSAMGIRGSTAVQTDAVTYDPTGSFKIRPTFSQVAHMLQIYATKKDLAALVRTLRKDQSAMTKKDFEAMRELVHDETGEFVTWDHLARLLAEQDAMHNAVHAEQQETIQKLIDYQAQSIAVLKKTCALLQTVSMRLNQAQAREAERTLHETVIEAGHEQSALETEKIEAENLAALMEAMRAQAGLEHKTGKIE